ncbi:MAG TPA: hypothetical protein VEZ42_18470 [Pseudonocardia sp.]|nr:hypothetical protein [Pseudonocardia sp.]
MLGDQRRGDHLRAAFGPEPGAAVRAAPGASPHDRWICAVTLGGQGWYAAAAALCTGLLTDRRVPRATAAHAAVTLASHRRQLGGHAAARPLDALGLRLAEQALREGASGPDAAGTDAAAARADALVGLAADAVGSGDHRTARRLLDRAEEATAAHPSWRPAVRACWVRAELALASGVPGDAVAPAELALAASRAAGSGRHELKSMIIAAVTRSAYDRSPTVARAAREELDIAAQNGTRQGLLPLVWPAWLAAADLVAAGPVANEWTREAASESTNDAPSGSTRRRHAANVTLNVIAARTDPPGRRLMGVSEWLPALLPLV